MATEEPNLRAPSIKVEVHVEHHAPASAGGGDKDELAARFDEVYASANGEAARVPWADCRACPLLVQWLNTEAPVLVRPGSRTAVVGCGLGDDVVELASRGYDVLGFDISPTAVRWAARRHPHHAERFMVADLLCLPARLQKRFDLVIEAYTLQSLEPSLRLRAAAAVASLVANRGVVLAVCRGRDAREDLAQCIAPPFPFTPQELCESMGAAGLEPMHGPASVEEAWDDEQPPKRRLRGVFARP